MRGVIFCVSVMISCSLLASSARSQAPTKKPAPTIRHSPFVPKGYKLTFNDEFVGKELDLTKWNYRQLGERDGTLLVEDTATLDGKGNLLLATDQKDGRIRCSMISTEKTFLQKYGYYESRIKFHRGQGAHGAFWLQSPTYGTVIDDLTASGVEIDIVEFFGAERSDGGTSANLHWNGYGESHRSLPGKLDAVNGLRRFAVAGRPRPEICDTFHEFGLEWTEQGYRFLIDGYEFFRTTEAVSHCNEYVILSLLSSAWERDRLNLQALPEIMTVDYVRVYAK